MRITQKLVPFAAWMEAIPSRAISEDVSKPRPKSTPSGYIFHGLRGSWIRMTSMGRRNWIYLSISLNISLNS